MNKQIGASNGVSVLVSISELQPLQREMSPQLSTLVSEFLLRLCIACTVGVLLLAGGELFAYLHHPYDAPDAMEPIMKRSTVGLSASEREYWRQYDAAHRLTYHPYVLWRHEPFQGSMINVTEDGIRRTAYTDCEPGNLTIWMFGDSTLWGTGATDEETIPSFLAEDYQRAGRKVCVVNYGEGAWANTQEVIELIEQLKHAARKPDIVVFYDGGTEAFTAYQSHRADVPSNFNNFKTYLDTWSEEQKPGFSYLRKTNTRRLLETISGKFSRVGNSSVPSVMTDDEVQSLVDGILQNYQQNMDIVALLAQRFGFRAIFTWYPVLVVGHKQLTEHEKEVEKGQEQEYPGITRMYRAAYSRCQQTHRDNLYYLGDVFDDQRDGIFRGISHLKPEGNRIVADHLFRILDPAHISSRNTYNAPGMRSGQRVHAKPV